MVYKRNKKISKKLTKNKGTLDTKGTGTLLSLIPQNLRLPLQMIRQKVSVAFSNLH